MSLPVHRRNGASPLARLRGAFRTFLLRPALRASVELEGYGAEELGRIVGRAPVLLVANHGSPLDASLVLATLPRGWRRRTAVESPRRLRRGGTVLTFPEGGPSSDGLVGAFDSEAVELAQQVGVPVVPVGIRGAYAATRPGHHRPRAGRPRVSVRYGLPLTAEAHETAETYTGRVQHHVQQLVAEDETTWWQTQRPVTGNTTVGPAARWRRIWQQTEDPAAGGQPRRRTIWRS